jgi:hypothetical protein
MSIKNGPPLNPKFLANGSLLQWIKTKKVSKCELCKYPFKLSKGISIYKHSNKVVYDPQMPSRVPHRLFIQRLILQLRNNVMTYLRFLLVCFIWLGLVPFCARWIWRFYFRFGDWSADSPSTAPSTTNITASNTQAEPSIERGIFEDGFFGWLKGGDLWTAVLRDCFQGQIITICLVAVFVVVFLIREWVMQNAVPAVEEQLAPIAPIQIPIPPQNQLNQFAFQQPILAQPQLIPERQDIQATGVHIQPAAYDPILIQEAFGDNPPFAEAGDHHHAAIEPGQFNFGQFQHHLPAQQFAQPPQFGRQPVFPAANNNWGANNDIPRVRDFDIEDDLDGDDFDGLWDILGMQGPIIGLLHNTVFSALMIALAVGLGVWLPFMFGKTALGALVFIPLIGGLTVGSSC